MKKLNQNETSEAYKLIRKASWHLANETSNTINAPDVLRKKMYFDIQNNLKKAYLKYDRETKTATSLKSLETLEKLLKKKVTPPSYSNHVPAHKIRAKKTTTKRGRI
jgi:hypothetical protein